MLDCTCPWSALPTSPSKGGFDGASFILEKSRRRSCRRCARRAGDGPGARGQRWSGSQVAAGVEFPQEPRYDLRRGRIDFQAGGGGDQRQVPDPGVRRRRNRAAVRRRRRRAERDGPVLPYGAVLLLRQGPDVRVRLRHSVRDEHAAAERVDDARRRPRAVQRLPEGIQHRQLRRRQHRRADGRLVPQGDQDRRRPEGPQDAHRGHRRVCRCKSWASFRSRSPAATSIRRWKRARSTPRSGSALTTTKSSVSTRSASFTTTRAGGKAVPSSMSSSTPRPSPTCRRTIRRSWNRRAPRRTST